MGEPDKLFENSEFVVCKACRRYFHVLLIDQHQGDEHKNFDWTKETTYSPDKYYFMTNREVAFTLNELVEIREVFSKVRGLRLI